MAYKYNNIVIKPGLYLGNQGRLDTDGGGQIPIFSSTILPIGQSRIEDYCYVLPGYKTILYTNPDISYVTKFTIDNTTGTNIMGVPSINMVNGVPMTGITGYGDAGSVSKVDLFYNNIKINYSNIKPIGFKSAARLVSGAKLGQYSDGFYNKYALVLESTTPKFNNSVSGVSSEQLGNIVGYNRPYLSLPWVQKIVTTKASHSFWWCSKGYESNPGSSIIDYSVTRYGYNNINNNYTAPSPIYSHSTILYIHAEAGNYLQQTQISFHGGATDNCLSFYILNENIYHYFYSTKNICDGLWHHIVWNIDGTTWTIYTDGVAETATGKESYNFSTKIAPGITLNGLTPTTIVSQIGGRRAAQEDIQTNGYIADYRFYKNTLSQQDITGLLNGDHTYRTSVDDTSGCLFQYTFAPETAYTNNNTTYAVGTATVPYAAEIRNGADIMMPSLDLTESVGNCLKIPPFTTGTNGFSISFWWKSDGLWATQGANSRLFYLGNGVSDLDNIYFTNEIGTNGYPSIHVSNTTVTTQDLTTLTNFCDDTWKHVVWTMASDLTWKLYINNTLINTYTGMVYPSAIQRSINNIGVGILSTDGYPCGFIGDFRLYNAVLSTTNIASLYNQTDTTDNEINLIQHYDFVNDTMNANNNILYSIAPTYALELTNSASTTGVGGQYASITGGLGATGTNGLTFSFWWKAKGKYASQGNFSRIFDIASDSAGTSTIIFACNYGTSNYPYIEMNRDAINTNRTSFPLTNLTDFCDGNWKHVVWTMTYSASNTSTWNLYVNNQRYGLGNLTTTGYYPTDIVRRNFFIGRSWAMGTLYPDGYPNGYIADFRVYKEVLTFDNITNLYNKVSTYTTNLLLQTLTPTTTPPDFFGYYTDLLDLINIKPPWGIYFADSHVDNILYEARNNGRNATTTGITKANASGNGAASSIPHITGTTASTITWPTGSIPSTFTLCTITRYTGSTNNKRILCAPNSPSGANFLHGHHENKRGVAFYEGWKTSVTSSGTLTDWLVMCGTNGTNNSTPGNILRDGTAIGTANGGTSLAPQLTVNSFEQSDFALSTVFIWDQALTNEEMVIVSNALSYYLSSGIPIIFGVKLPSTSVTQIMPYQSLYLNATQPSGALSSLSSNLITTNGVSFAFWFKPNGAHGSSNPMIFDFGNAAASDNIFFCKNSVNDSPRIRIYKGGAGSTAVNLTDAPDFFSKRVWKHAVWTMTYSAGSTSTWTVYINGVSKELTTTGNYPNILARTSCLIGKSNWTIDGLTNGIITDFRVYNRVLTQRNVSALYNGTYTDNTSLFLQYPINASGQTNPNTITFSLTGSATITPPSLCLVSNPSLVYYTGSYLSLPPLVQTGVNGLSFSFWWRADASKEKQGNRPRLFSFSNGRRKDTIEFMLNYNAVQTTNTSGLRVENGIKVTDIGYSADLWDGNWKHIVWTMTYCGPTQATSTWNIYVNNSQIGAGPVTTTGTYPTNVSRKFAYIGRSAFLTTYSYPTGCFADFRVYSAVLNADNITSLYNRTNTTDKESNLILKRTFDSTESYLYQTCDTIKPSVLMENNIDIESTGTGQHVVFPALPSNISTDTANVVGMTFSFWWKSKGLSGVNGRLFEIGYASATDIYYLKTRNGQVDSTNTTGSTSSPTAAFYYGYDIDADNNINNPVCEIQNLENGLWHHIAWTVSNEGNGNSSFWKFYMDGVFLQQKYYSTGTHLPYIYNNNLRNEYINNFIGRSSWSIDKGCVNGYISDFRIYNKCLTVQEIDNIYTNTFTDNSDLFLRYSFEQKKQIENIASVYNEEIITSNKTLILTFNNTDSLLKFDLTRNVPATLSDSATITNTGKLGSGNSIYNLSFFAGNNQFEWYPNPPSINGVMPAYCISFNQTNVLSAQTTAINFLTTRIASGSVNVAAGSSFSLSLWIRPTGLTFSQTYVRYHIAHIFQEATSTTPVVEMWLEANTNGNERKIFVLFNNSFVGYKVSTVQLSLDTWYHIAFVVGSNTTPVLYINGTNVGGGGSGGSDSLLTVSINTFNVLVLGARYDTRTGSNTGHKGFRGQMAFVNYFNKVLTASDITYLYNNPAYTPTLTNNTAITTITGHPIGLTNAFNTSSTGFDLLSTGTYGQISKIAVGGDLGLSFAVWFKPTSNTHGNYGRIFDFGSGEFSNNIVIGNKGTSNEMVFYENHVISGTTYSMNYYLPVSGFFTDTTTWKHVVWTLTYSTTNTSTWTVYINGQKYTGTGSYQDTAGSITQLAANHTLEIGRYPQNTERASNFFGRSNWVADSYLNGHITGFYMYNRVLTASEALNLYNNTPISTADLHFSTNFALNPPTIYTPSHSTDSTQLGRLYNGATLSKDVYKFGTSSLFLSNYDEPAEYVSSTTNTHLIGSGQYMATVAPLPKLGTRGFSISFWWKSAGTPQPTANVIFAFGNEGNDNNQIMFWLGKNINDPPAIEVKVTNNTFYDQSIGVATNFNNGNWHHVVINFNNNDTWEYFYDNVSSGTLSSKIYPANISRTRCYFGRSLYRATAGYHNNRYANGYIDEFRIHSTIMNATNVANLYNNNDSSDIDKYLVSYYSFNQDTIRTKMDETYIDNNVLDTPIFNT